MLKAARTSKRVHGLVMILLVFALSCMQSTQDVKILKFPSIVQVVLTAPMITRILNAH
jgi:hypothetical protein